MISVSHSEQPLAMPNLTKCGGVRRQEASPRAKFWIAATTGERQRRSEMRKAVREGTIRPKRPLRVNCVVWPYADRSGLPRYRHVGVGRHVSKVPINRRDCSDRSRASEAATGPVGNPARGARAATTRS